MTHNASPLVRALARIVVGDLEETVATATPASWREALAMVLTYAKDEQLVALCQQLGDRLEAAGCLDEALLCAVCAVDIPAMIRLGLQIHPDCSVRSHLSVAEALLILCSMTNPQTLDLPAAVSSTTSAQRLATLCVELQQRGMQSVASRLVAVLVRSPSARAVVEVLHAMDPALAPAVPAVTAQPAVPAQTVQAAQPAMPAVSAKPAKPVAVRPAQFTPMQPMQPAMPAMPMQPAMPAMPVQQTQPATPKPFMSSLPVQPAYQPVQPVMPAQPALPAQPVQTSPRPAPFMPTMPVMPSPMAQPAMPAQPAQPVEEPVTEMP